MKDWKKTGEAIAYQGWRSIIQRQFELPNGDHSTFDVVDNNAYVTIAAVTKSEQFILVQQFRPGPEQVLLSFPEGYIDPNEQPEEAGRRELLEETGYRAEQVQFIKQKLSAYSTERQFMLLATGCELVAKQNLDANEFIEVVLMDRHVLRTFLKEQGTSNFTNFDAAYLAFDHLGWF